MNKVLVQLVSEKYYRSQKGNGDSEIALVVEDTDMIDSRMNGEPVRLFFVISLPVY